LSCRPYVVSLGWGTTAVATCVVRVGTSAGSLTKTYNTPVTPLANFILPLTGLNAAVTYYYELSCTSTTLHASSFTTLPALGAAKPMRALLLGDPGTGTSVLTDVAAAATAFMVQTNTLADAWFVLGDNAYSSGTRTEYITRVGLPMCVYII
jgi:hypothetical protein